MIIKIIKFDGSLNDPITNKNYNCNFFINKIKIVNKI